MKYGWKWVEIRPPGLGIRLFESQDHDESNETPPEPKYLSEITQIDPTDRCLIVRFLRAGTVPDTLINMLRSQPNG
jgi:hypothetical protein